MWQLPIPHVHGDQERYTGVEVEFSGLTEREAAEVVVELWGGSITNLEPHVVDVSGTELGTMKIELDTAWKKEADSRLVDTLLEWSRKVVPVEIVTDPLPSKDVQKIDQLMNALARSGAEGSKDSVLLALGIHLNTEVASETADFIVPVVRAFAFVEQWLRTSDPPDISRRLLPFIDPWPREFIDRCAEEGSGWRLDDLRDTYLDIVASRNHGLDLLPLLENIFPEHVRAALPKGQAKGGRPTWHYRLPETNLAVDDWSIAYEWNRWVLVERVAADADLLGDLANAWTAHRSSLASTRMDWPPQVERLLGRSDLWQE